MTRGYSKSIAVLFSVWMSLSSSRLAMRAWALWRLATSSRSASFLLRLWRRVSIRTSIASSLAILFGNELDIDGRVGVRLALGWHCMILPAGL